MAREMKLPDVQLMPPQARSADTEEPCGMRPTHVCLAPHTLEETTPEASAHWLMSSLKSLQEAGH